MKYVLIRGQHDSRHHQFFNARDGEQRANPMYGVPFDTITFEEICARASNPPLGMGKAVTDAVMPTDYSDYDLRSPGIGREQKYWYLSLDVDTNNYPLEQVTATVRRAVGENVSFLVYSTQSAWTDSVDEETGELTNKGARWAVIIPMARPLNHIGLRACGLALIDIVQYYGLKIDDTSSAQIKRLRFLPALGPAGYAFHVEKGQHLALTDTHHIYMAARKHIDEGERAERERAQRAADFALNGRKDNSGSRSYIAAYKRKHPTTPELLEWLGFITNDGGVNWHHVSQTTKSYATELFPDGTLYTRSATVAAMSRGLDSNGGCYFDDTFDIMCAVHYSGNHEHMVEYAKSLLAAEDEAFFGKEVLANAKWFAAVLSDTSEYPMWCGENPLNAAAVEHKTAYLAEQLTRNDAEIKEALEKREVIAAPEAHFEEAATGDDRLEPTMYNGPPLNDEWFESLLKTQRLPDRIPPGLVGDLFKYARDNVVTAALPEMLIPMALSFTSTMALNAYYVERVGINDAYVVVADTAVGKSTSFSPFRSVLRALEHLPEAQGLPDALKNTDKDGNPVGGFRFLQGWPSHGNSLHKRLFHSPSILLFADEFGARLLEAQTNNITKSVVDFMTTAITASGPNSSLDSTAYTDDAKTLGTITNASLNVMGLMVPDQWEQLFTREAAGSGALNRRLVFEEMKRPGLPIGNRTEHKKPPARVVDAVAQLTNHAFNHLTKSTDLIQVQVDSVDTARYMSDFNKYIWYQSARRDRDEVERNMWARIYVHCLKVAATVAVGVNHINPTITMEIFRWAQQLVSYSHSRILWRLNNGAYAGNPNKEYQQAKDAIIRYIGLSRQSKSAIANASGALLDPGCQNVFRVNNIAALLRSKGVWDKRVPKLQTVAETAHWLHMMADDGLIEEVSELELGLLKLKANTKVPGNRVFVAKSVLIGEK